MESNLEAALEKEGWIVECESPLEIRLQDDPESFATGQAAQIIIDAVEKRMRRKSRKSTPKQGDPDGWDSFGWPYK